MKGKGIASKVLGVIPKILNIGKEGRKKNPKWDYKLKKNPDEKHTVIMRDGISYNSAFAGPSTHVYENITNLIDKYGSISEVLANADDWSPDPAIDLAGLRHDVEYALAGQEYIDGDTAKSKARVEGADKRFLKDLMGTKSFINALAPGALIKAKADVLPYSSFIEKAVPLKPKEWELYNKVLREFGVDNPYFAPVLKKTPLTKDNAPLAEGQRVGDENYDPNAFTSGGKRTLRGKGNKQSKIGLETNPQVSNEKFQEEREKDLETRVKNPLPQTDLRARIVEEMTRPVQGRRGYPDSLQRAITEAEKERVAGMVRPAKIKTNKQTFPKSTGSGRQVERPVRRIEGKRNQCLHVYHSGKSKGEQCTRMSMHDLCSAHSRIRHP